MSSFSINSMRMGRAVTAQAMPRPRTNCHDWPLAPIQAGVHASRPMAATQPNASGTPSARLAVILVSPRCNQAFLRSSSTPAMQTKSETPHQATPLSDWMTGVVKTKL